MLTHIFVCFLERNFLGDDSITGREPKITIQECIKFMHIYMHQREKNNVERGKRKLEFKLSVSFLYSCF